MYQPDLVDVPIEIFGGYCPAIPPSGLSPGAASIAQDVIFPQGGLRSRGGLRNVFGAQLPNVAAITGLKSYITPTLAQRLMVWAAGNSVSSLYKENPQGTLTLIGSRTVGTDAARNADPLFYQSATLFGREYQAFFNSAGGFDIPRQFDDTNWDRVSQAGPGVAPNVADEALSFTITAAPNGLLPAANAVITNLTQAGNLVTVTAALPLTLMSGDTIQITAATVAGYNGTWVIVSVIGTTQLTFINPTGGLAPDASGTGLLHFTLFNVVTTANNPFVTGMLVKVAGAGVAGYNGTWVVRVGSGGSAIITVNGNAVGLAASGNGTVSAAGNIPAGRHNVSVAFITQQNFITPAAPPSFWNAAGGLRGVVSGIPTGPNNIKARLLLFTTVIVAPATQGSFFSLPNGSTQVFSSLMLINDNTASTLTVDFTDTVLASGFNANYLATQLELGEPTSFIGYNSRLVALGERNRVPNFVNLSFDGGGAPAGWNLAAGGGGVNGGVSFLTADWGGSWQITGDGATAIGGKITQSAYVDYLGVPIIQRNTSYSVRARVGVDKFIANGVLHINLQSTSQAFTTVGLAVILSTAAGSSNDLFFEFTASLTDTPIANPPSDLLLQVYVDGTLTNTKSCFIDSIEIYPTNTPVNYSTARVSHAFNPESFDSVTGQIQIRPGDGQKLTADFPLRNNLYFAKDHYLCYVTDDGVNEPSSWAVNEVSASVGICGPNAVDWTEEWAVFAERSGLYICWGSDPVKISPEIQNDASGTGQISWASINWASAHTLWVRIDKINKMILVGAPINGATSPNIIFMLDYRWLESGQMIAESPLITYSAFTGKILSHGRGRRWAIWNISAPSMTFAERSDGTSQPFFGSTLGIGKVYQQYDATSQPSDDGTAIPWNYQFYGCPSHMEEQAYQLGAHRKLLGYIKWRAIGSGTLNWGISTTARSTLLRGYTLSTSPTGDGERPLNLQAERFFPTIRTNSSTTAWFQLEKLILCIRKSGTIPVRGLSA